MGRLLKVKEGLRSAIPYSALEKLDTERAIYSHDLISRRTALKRDKRSEIGSRSGVIATNAALLRLTPETIGTILSLCCFHDRCDSGQIWFPFRSPCFRI